MEQIVIFIRCVNLETCKSHKDFLQFIPITDLSKKKLPLMMDNFIQ